MYHLRHQGVEQIKDVKAAYIEGEGKSRSSVISQMGNERKRADLEYSGCQYEQESAGSCGSTYAVLVGLGCMATS
jgi:uncharacterized membrane protein YcaP (DUF421 family)